MEEWKDIIGYEGIYKVSNHAKILSFHDEEPKLMSHLSRIDNSYQLVGLTKQKRIRNFCVHRLVALHFVPNPYNHPIVDHLDRNRQNNIFTNLEWVTYKENTRRWVAMDKIKYDQMQPGVSVRWLGTEHVSKIKSRKGIFLTLEQPPPNFPYPVSIKHVKVIQ